MPKDSNICEHCNLYVPISAKTCPNCEQALVVDASGKLSIWRLDDIRDGVLGHVSVGLREAFGAGVVIQPAFLDPRLSQRPRWNGISANVFLAQVHRRHTDGTFVNLGITELNIVPDVKHNFLFGYAYLGFPAAVISLKPLTIDEPDSEILIRRALSIAIHEIGHTLDLDHHTYSDNTDCVMVGDDKEDSLETIDNGGISFCATCRSQIQQKLQGLCSHTT